MAKTRTYPRRRSILSYTVRGKNRGKCAVCSESVSWRSVHHKCWKCEIETMQDRRPMYVEREILMAVSNLPRFP
jgi:hypothetical protein